jgi:hypothetical protein
VRNGNTASGDASILISLLTVNVPAATSSPFLGFHFLLQVREAARPEGLEGGLQFCERVAVRAIETPGAIPPVGHEPSRSQDREVL